MPSESSQDVKFEIGHVLFIDIVGYSKLLINEQSEQIQKLREIVRGTEQFRVAETEGKLMRLPTGDGGALVFRSSPESPVLCALEIAKTLKNHPELRVRMGIHSGPVNEVTDLNEQANIAGAGINIAQRVMDCGDAGHILLSKRVAGDLDQYPQWRSQLHDLGECEVKHGVRVSVVNLYTDELGNSAVPEKFKTARQTGLPAPARRGPSLIALGVFLLLLTALAIPLLIFAPALLKSLSRRPAPASSSSPAAAATIAEKSVAVLPFENLSADKANAYFADGIQDEILTKLASIADLKVISRTSTAKYKSKPEDLKTVSEQLGVANVVEGTVQRAADKVRVNVQLIDARADAHLWAKTYDRDINDVFAVESEVSQEIADALQAKLSPNEANTLATAPTKDPEAYDAFLKGEYEEREAESSLKAEPFDRAAPFYQQALDRDPKFALAAARLAENRIVRHWFVRRLREAELPELKSLADHAVALGPNLAEAHLALGSFYYYGKLQFHEALEEFGKALKLQPNNVRSLELSAYIYRRQGQLERALSELAKCEERDPQDGSLVRETAATYCALRMWPEAKRAASRSLALEPHGLSALSTLFLSCLNGAGDLNEAKRALAMFPEPPRITIFLTVQSAIGPYIHVMERDFAGALKACETKAADPDENRSRLVARVAIHVLAGDTASAQGEIEQTRDLLERQLSDRPDDAFAMMQLSWANLALNREADALRLAHQGTDLHPLEKDFLTGAAFLTALAQIEARADQPGDAVTALRRLLSIPAGTIVSIAQLKIDPVWDPIRNDPGFQQLLAGKELVGPNK
jgi:TolB-like protein/class 3 adenylate cyclase/Tfp pilus assembly protein PilF